MGRSIELKPDYTPQNEQTISGSMTRLARQTANAIDAKIVLRAIPKPTDFYLHV